MSLNLSCRITRTVTAPDLTAWSAVYMENFITWKQILLNLCMPECRSTSPYHMPSSRVQHRAACGKGAAPVHSSQAHRRQLAACAAAVAAAVTACAQESIPAPRWRGAAAVPPLGSACLYLSTVS